MPKAAKQNDQEKQATQDRRIAITAPLRNAAVAVTRAWENIDFEQLANETDTVIIHCRNVESAQTFLKEMEPVAKLTDPSSPPLHPLPTLAEETTLRVWIGHYLPAHFDGIVRDIAQANGGVIEIPESQLACMRYYQAAFEGVLRSSVPVDDPGVRASEATPVLVETNRRLLAFIGALLQIVSDNPHIIDITAGFEFRVDGKNAVVKGATVRTLLSLSLLPNLFGFPVAAFAKLYTGKDKLVEPKQDFDNALRRLKNLLPRMSWEGAGNSRTVRNIVWGQLPPDDARKQKLLTFSSAPRAKV